MPSVDMPLPQLQAYMGGSPCPEDFDAYWERGLSELDKMSLAYEIVPDAFQASGVECGHLYFTGVGGAKIHAKFLRPTKMEKQAPAILLFHGYQGHSRDFFEKLPFAQSGAVVLALDVRGQAGPSEDNGKITGSTFRGHIVRGMDEKSADHLAFRNIFLDTVQLARIAASMDFVDKENICAAGFSQGGALTFACAALSGLIRRAAVGYPFLSDYKRVWDMDLGGFAYDELRLYFRLQDPTHQNEEQFFGRLGYIDIQNLAKRVKSQVRFYTGLMDNICPPSTQFAAYNKLDTEKSMVLYPDFGHEELPHAWQDAYTFLLQN